MANIQIQKVNILPKLNTQQNKQDKLFNLEDFMVLSLLGYGTFGCVLLVQNFKTDECYAVKVI